MSFVFDDTTGNGRKAPCRPLAGLSKAEVRALCRDATRTKAQRAAITLYVEGKAENTGQPHRKPRSPVMSWQDQVRTR